MSDGMRSTLALRVARIGDVLRRAPVGGSGWLSPSEQERYAGLRVASRANQYLAGHWLAREVLAELLGGQAADWPLRERRSRAPVPESESCGGCLSISHSGDYVAAAAAFEPIGIDLEQRRPRAGLLAFAHLLRAEDDACELDEDTLLQRWVIKEAWIKRQGGGALPERLAGIALRRSSDESTAQVRLWRGEDLHVAFCGSALIAPDLSGESQFWEVSERARSA